MELCETGAALDEEACTGCQKHKNADISRELRRSASEGTRWYVQEEISSALTVGLSAVVQNTRTSTPSSPPLDSQKRMRSAPEICTKFFFLQIGFIKPGRRISMLQSKNMDVRGINKAEDR